MNRTQYPRRNFSKIVWLLCTTFFIFQNFAVAQTAQNLDPSRREQLLNGFKILFFSEPKSETVTLKMRINSGSAFDPTGKEGLMKLSANLLFDEGVKTLFTEDYGGSLTVTSNYDYIQIDATGKNENLLSMLDLLQTAVMNFPPPLERIKEEREKLLAEVTERRKNPAIVADEAVAKRLFGNFPYGRSEFGSPESLTKIDRPDFLLVREKFFTADNSTLAIVGNVQANQTLRALKQFFGAWQKSDKLVPPTFRQPDAPDSKTLILVSPVAEKGAYRKATNGFARNDKDFFANRILEQILQKNFQASGEKISHKSYLLRGINVSGNSLDLTVPPPAAFPPKTSFTQSEFDEAKAKIIKEFQTQTQLNGTLAHLWLDVETYKLVSGKDELSKLSNVTLADVQRISDKLQKETPVSVLVRKAKPAEK